MRKLRLNRPLVIFVVVAPEFAKLAGAAIPTERANDDKYIRPTLTGKAGKPYEEFFYDKGNSLSAVRSGKWKLHANKGTPTQLHDPDNDIGLEQDPRRTLMQSVAGFNWLETTPDSPPSRRCGWLCSGGGGVAGRTQPNYQPRFYHSTWCKDRG